DADPTGALAFSAGKGTAPAGALQLIMKNPSNIQHDIAVEGNGIKKVGKVVGHGGTSTVTATLKPGTYTFLCTVPGHAAGGMKCTGGSSDQVVDPWVSIGRRGVAYFASLPLSVPGFLVNRSANGGASWSAPATADPGAGLTDDLPSVVADPRRRGRAYLTWSRFTFNGSEMT